MPSENEEILHRDLSNGFAYPALSGKKGSTFLKEIPVNYNRQKVEMLANSLHCSFKRMPIKDHFCSGIAIT